LFIFSQILSAEQENEKKQHQIDIFYLFLPPVVSLLTNEKFHKHDK